MLGRGVSNKGKSVGLGWVLWGRTQGVLVSVNRWLCPVEFFHRSTDTFNTVGQKLEDKIVVGLFCLI